MGGPKGQWRTRIAAGGLLLLLATLWTYGPVRRHDFITYDDPVYITENPEVQKGLTVEGARWAVTTTLTGNWHPVTWLSHMTDVTLWDLRPGAHHLTSAALHAINALLLYLLLVAMTGAIAPSLFVAAAFALHPLHVESVAWAAERKDLLCAFFGLLALGAWVGWTRRRTGALYGASLLAYALSLASKPMLVTLPALLLLLDVWPLGRLSVRGGEASPGLASSEGANAWARFAPFDRTPVRALASRLVEKIPFAALAAIFAVVALVAQSRTGATASLEAVGLGSRIQNAIVASASYIASAVLPVDLGVLYPLRERTPVWLLEGAAFLLVTATLLCLAGAKRRPWLAVGWLWYLVSLLPVLGLVQIGVQAKADRYTYLPLIGLFIIAAWGLPEIFRAPRARRIALGAATAACLISWVLLTRVQLGTWRDSVTLYRHALAVDNRNPVIHYNLADALAADGRRDEAVAHYRAALAFEPDFLEARNNLGNALRSMGRLEEAIASYRAAVYYDPGYALAHDNLGLALADAGRLTEASAHYLEALRLDPEFVAARRNLGRAQFAMGRLDEASKSFRKALESNPDDAEARYRLGNVLAEEGRPEEALAEYERSIASRPDAAAVRIRRASILISLGRTAEASADYCQALRLDPRAEDLARAGALPLSRAALTASVARFRGHCPLGPGTKARESVEVKIAGM